MLILMQSKYEITTLKVKENETILRSITTHYGQR
jgi:hypothetical protein